MIVNLKKVALKLQNQEEMATFLSEWENLMLKMEPMCLPVKDITITSLRNSKGM